MKVSIYCNSSIREGEQSTTGMNFHVPLPINVAIETNLIRKVLDTVTLTKIAKVYVFNSIFIIKPTYSSDFHADLSGLWMPIGGDLMLGKLLGPRRSTAVIGYSQKVLCRT